MPVSIDTVYQRVLALANKEQRGYITPQEYNLLANQAQLLTFEQYFYDMDKALDTHANNTEYSDRTDILLEKIAPFEQFEVAMSALANTNELTLPVATAVHKLGTVFYNGGSSYNEVVVERVDKNELKYMQATALIAPTYSRPVYVRKTNAILKIFPSSTSPATAYATSNVSCNYTAKPTRAVWGYTVVNSQALYDATFSTDFQLHESEETELVYKILELAGVVLNKPGLVQIATNEETALIAKKQ